MMKLERESLNMSNMSNLVKKLHKVQKALKTPKDLTNNFGKYKYRNAESILEALKEVMPEDCITKCTIGMVRGIESLQRYSLMV